MEPMDKHSTQPDAYATYLSRVNRDNEVTATDDIVNERGVLLVRRGGRIDGESAERLLKHKLVKPLESQVQLQHSLSSEERYSDFRGLLQRYPDLAQVHERLRFAWEFEQLMLDGPLHPLLVQKLTVLKSQLPDTYRKALLCSWLAPLIARELGGSVDPEAAFLGGLVHDLGFLHIDPQILDKETGLTPPEWRAIQSHVLIGKIILEEIPGLPGELSAAVEQHHERCDGTGYPTSKGADQLGRLGQVLGMADSLEAIRVNRFPRTGRNLRDTLPYLQLNTHTHFPEVYHAMARVLGQSGLEPTAVTVYGSDLSLLRRLARRGEQIGQAARLLRQALQSAGPCRTERLHARVTRVLEHVCAMLASSGVPSEELRRWMASLEAADDPDIRLTLSETELLQDEFVWQIGNARKALLSCLSNGGEGSSSMADLVAGLDEVLSELTADTTGAPE